MAVLVGVLHAGASSVLSIGDVKPNLVLVAVAVLVLFGGPLRGAWWAFVAGATVDVAVGSALGSTSLGLLVVAAGLGTVSAAVGRVRPVYAPVAVLVVAIAVELLPVAVREVAGVAGARPSVWIVFASALVSAVVAALVVMVLSRRDARRRPTVAGSPA